MKGNKVLRLLMAVITLTAVSGCAGLTDFAAANADNNTDNIYDLISEYCGSWTIDDVYQFPAVSEYSPDEVIDAEGGVVTISAEVFESSTTMIRPEYNIREYSMEELQSIGFSLDSVSNELNGGAKVIEICDVNNGFSYCYLVVEDADSLLFVSTSGYIFHIVRE